MPTVTFYILSEQSKRTPDQLICQLCVKAAEKSAVQLVLSEPDLATFDDLLWSFDETSFLTHGVNDTAAKVNLTSTADAGFSGIVVNKQDAAVLMNQAQRIIEIIAADETSKVAGRQRYKAYKDAGFALETFNV